MEKTNVIEPGPAPAAAGIHFDTVREKIPRWLYQAAPEIRLLFREHLLALETSRHEVRQIMAQLQKIDVFCMPRLARALERQINGEQALQDARFVRVDTTYLSSIFEDKLYSFAHSQTLLEAALQNFEADETERGGARRKGRHSVSWRYRWHQYLAGTGRFCLGLSNPGLGGLVSGAYRQRVQSSRSAPGCWRFVGQAALCRI
ncbi:dermonecrotic toxin domain-containing protein [Pseudomonas gingeri]|uniref:dermonecrotic toxin domain-containing protein n=1 Tax=Pseudomonas gingeri TaxID=117681 RepID=UPI00210ED9D4|nr:DUF6543 domain-containing protein [Pseudomonas gingeri]